MPGVWLVQSARRRPLRLWLRFRFKERQILIPACTRPGEAWRGGKNYRRDVPLQDSHWHTSPRTLSVGHRGVASGWEQWIFLGRGHHGGRVAALSRVATARPTNT